MVFLPGIKRRGRLIEELDRSLDFRRAEVTASGAGRLCDEESFVGSTALGCIEVPSGAGKSENPGKEAICV